LLDSGQEGLEIARIAITSKQRILEQLSNINIKATTVYRASTKRQSIFGSDIDRVLRLNERVCHRDLSAKGAYLCHCGAKAVWVNTVPAFGRQRKVGHIQTC
jgi:hypothetical protein